MCVGVPGRITRLEGTDIDRVADIDFGSSTRQASVSTLPDAAVGEWVIIHSGFVVRRLSDAEAQKAAQHFAEAAQRPRS